MRILCLSQKKALTLDAATLKQQALLWKQRAAPN